MDIPASEFKPTILKWLPDELEVTVYIRSFKDCVFSLLSNKKILLRVIFLFHTQKIHILLNLHHQIMTTFLNFIMTFGGLRHKKNGAI